MAAPLTVPRPVRVGRTRSRWRTTSRIERSRSNAIPITSHTTYSAGSLRRRIVAVPVASYACAIHAASSVPLKSSKLGARSPAPTARMASPNSIAPTSVGETNYTLWINGSRRVVDHEHGEADRRVGGRVPCRSRSAVSRTVTTCPSCVLPTPSRKPRDDFKPDCLKSRHPLQCVCHVLDQLPRTVQPKAREMLTAIPYAPTRAAAERLRDALANAYGRTYPKAV